MEVEPWEALNLDDSDLPTLRRTCKRRRSTYPTTPAANPLSQSPSSRTSEEILPEELEQQPLPSASLRRTIPGPAGAVQAAILRKNHDSGNQDFSNYPEDNRRDFKTNPHNAEVIWTQDCTRRAMEDTGEFDDDFTRHPWISAIQFLGPHRYSWC